MPRDCWLGERPSLPEPDRGRIDGMDSAAKLGEYGAGSMLLLIGADNTAMAEFDSCGGSEAARLAAAEGDILDCCCC